MFAAKKNARGNIVVNIYKYTSSGKYKEYDAFPVEDETKGSELNKKYTYTFNKPANNNTQKN